MFTISPSSDELRDLCRRPGSGSRTDLSIGDLSADLLGDGLGDHVWGSPPVVHPPPRSVSVQPVSAMEVLLEVVPKGEVQERPTVRGELHGRGEAPLAHREVAGP